MHPLDGDQTHGVLSASPECKGHLAPAQDTSCQRDTALQPQCCHASEHPEGVRPQGFLEQQQLLLNPPG